MEDLKKNLWKSADKLRVDSSLTSQQYSLPILGLIFLKFIDVKFTKKTLMLEKDQGKRRTISKIDYQKDGIIFIQPESKYSNFLKLSEGDDIGKKINFGMELIEKENESLKGILPKKYQELDNDLLINILKRFNSIPEDDENDLFGEIYEYFLGKFALSEGRGGGEFFTPTSVTKLISHILETTKGRIYDPACGSGGMFIQAINYLKNKGGNNRELSIYGQDSKDINWQIGKLNLAAHGIEGDIKQGNSYYNDVHKMIGGFDYVMANPPFNVDDVDKEKIKNDKRFVFGIPSSNNANYLWIQIFYSALNSNGRAGFVMANSSSDAGQSELEIRKKIIESGHVEVMISCPSNLFYNVTLPVTLWFFNKNKPENKKDKILFIDAREIFTVIDRAHNKFSKEQIQFFSNIVKLHRGQKIDVPKNNEDLTNKHFPDGLYKDIIGICKSASIKEVEEQGWSLNSGRYVGIVEKTISKEKFSKNFQNYSSELKKLFEESKDLEKQIVKNIDLLKPK